MPRARRLSCSALRWRASFRRAARRGKAAEPSPTELIEGLLSGRAPVGGPFELTDHTGRRRTDADFRGKLVVLYFGYTSCPDVCPTELQSISLALDQLGAAAEAVQPLFITVDPERDTPARLADFVSSFHPRFVGLTGALPAIRKTAIAYKTFFAQHDTAAANYPVDHTGFVYLVGKDGRYLRLPAARSSPPDAIADAIRARLATASSGAMTRRMPSRRRRCARSETAEPGDRSRGRKRPARSPSFPDRCGRCVGSAAMPDSARARRSAAGRALDENCRARPLSPYGQPSKYADKVVRIFASAPGTTGTGASRTPHHLLDGMITPNGPAFRAASQRHSRHRSGGAPAADPRPGQASAGLHARRADALSDGVAHRIHRVRRQQRAALSKGAGRSSASSRSMACCPAPNGPA